MLALRRCNLSKTIPRLTRLSSSRSVKANAPIRTSPQPQRTALPNMSTTTPTPTPTTSGASSSRDSDAMAVPLPSPVQPLLEAAPPASHGSETPTLRVGGDALKLDAMGPLVVNVDGSVGRVANWAEMTPGEKEGTTRLLKRRNEQRLKVLREKMGIEEGGK